MIDNDTTPNINSSDTIMIQPATKRTVWRNIFLILAIALGVYTMIMVATNVGGDDMQSFPDIWAGIDWHIMVMVPALVIVALLCDVFKYWLVCRTMTGRANILTCLKVAIVGKYYDNVTPFHTGGQPVQMVYLHKKGISVGDSSAIITAKFFANTFAWLIVGCVLLFNVSALDMLDSSTRMILLVGSWIGVIAHASIPTIIVLFVVAPKFTQRLLAWIVGVGAKLRIVKDKQATYTKFVGAVEEYKNSLKILSQHKVKAILLVLVCLVEPLVVYSMPYLIMLALPSGVEVSSSMLLTVMTINAFATFAVMVVPTPGNSGVIEWITSLAFASIASGVLFWVVFLWRCMVYYIFIILGMLMTIYELIRNAIRNRKHKKLCAHSDSCPPTVSSAEDTQSIEDNQHQ